MEQQPAIFLDRDNTLNVDRGYTWKISDFAWIKGAPEALALFHAHGIPVFIVTNQGGIGKGLYSIEDMQAFNDHLRAAAAAANGPITDIAFCGHHPDAIDAKWKTPCTHRKPEPGMLLALADKWNLDLGRSVMIGDSERDVEAGKAAGCYAYKFGADDSDADLGKLAAKILKTHFRDPKPDKTKLQSKETQANV
jgi:D-glycero-D-manno-heptose 1,7-bisphosphate phosphatase